jgi:cyclopropane-fatty-acyl-phospholipid synthase
VLEAARSAGVELVHAESLRPHYARTLDCWANNLAGNEALAIAMVGADTYRTYLKYLTDCATFFRSGECNVYQFKFRQCI